MPAPPASSRRSLCQPLPAPYEFRDVLWSVDEYGAGRGWRKDRLLLAGGAGMTLTADGGYRPFNEADKPEGFAIRDVGMTQSASHWATLLCPALYAARQVGVFPLNFSWSQCRYQQPIWIFSSGSITLRFSASIHQLAGLPIPPVSSLICISLFLPRNIYLQSSQKITAYTREGFS